MNNFVIQFLIFLSRIALKYKAFNLTSLFENRAFYVYKHYRLLNLVNPQQFVKDLQEKIFKARKAISKILISIILLLINVKMKLRI